MRENQVLTKRFLWASLVITALACGPALAGSIEIIVNPESKVTSIGRAELSKIFLRRLRTWADGKRAVPVDQLPSSDAREAFTRLVHGRSVVTVEVYWKRMIFSGRGVPPEELASDAEVLEFVRSTPGAVGYVTSSEALEGVQKLALRD